MTFPNETPAQKAACKKNHKPFMITFWPKGARMGSEPFGLGACIYGFADGPEDAHEQPSFQRKPQP